MTKISNKNLTSIKDLNIVKNLLSTSGSKIYENRIPESDDTIVEAQVHLVFVNNLGKPVKIPDEIYSKFKPYFCDTIRF